MSETATMPPVAVAFGADHAGVALKDTLADALGAEGFAVHGLGTTGTNAVAYPEYAHRVANAVTGRHAARLAKLGLAGKAAA